MLLLELGELRLLGRDLFCQHVLEGGQRPLTAGKAAEGALPNVCRKIGCMVVSCVMSRNKKVSALCTARSRVPQGFRALPMDRYLKAIPQRQPETTERLTPAHTYGCVQQQVQLHGNCVERFGA